MSEHPLELAHPEDAPHVHNYAVRCIDCGQDLPAAVARLLSAATAKHEPRAVRFHLADERPITYPGVADGATWNGFDVVRVTPATRDAIIADIDYVETIDDLRSLPTGSDGLITLDGYVSVLCTPECAAEHHTWPAEGGA